MKIIFSIILLSLSLSAFAEKFQGRVEESEYASERCDITVKNIGRGKKQKMQVQVFALGESFRMVLPLNATSFPIKSSSLQLPRNDIRGKGVFDRGRPVSLQLNVIQKLNDYVIQESINCTF